MRYLSKDEQALVQTYLDKAAHVAKAATCTRSRCGAIIVYDNEVIGAGYNSPPLELENQRRCEIEKDTYDMKVTDKTCCMHAEQRAVFDALATHPGKLSGSCLYFVRLNDADDEVAYAGQPYCTICSKLALDVGIAEFVLWHEAGVAVYPTEEYNDLSYAFTTTGALDFRQRQ